MPYTYIPNLKVLVPRNASRDTDAILYAERADHVNAPAAGTAEIWVKNTVPTTLIFTDDAGTDHSLITGYKESVRLASTANIANLATDLEGGADSLDGVALVIGDRVLLKNQSTGAENGIYDITAGAATRAPDLPTGSLAATITMRVQEGTANGDTEWYCSNNTGSDVVNTASLVFIQTSGDVSFISGTVVSNQIAIYDTNGNQIKGATTPATIDPGTGDAVFGNNFDIANDLIVQGTSDLQSTVNTQAPVTINNATTASGNEAVRQAGDLHIEDGDIIFSGTGGLVDGVDVSALAIIANINSFGIGSWTYDGATPNATGEFQPNNTSAASTTSVVLFQDPNEGGRVRAALEELGVGSHLVFRSTDDVASVHTYRVTAIGSTATTITYTMTVTNTVGEDTWSLESAWGLLVVPGPADVVGPVGGATNDAIAVYDGTTGRLLKDSTGTIAQIVANTAKISYTDAVAVGLNTAKISYTDAAAVGLNTTHRGSDGKNHADVVTNNAKISYTDAAAVTANTARAPLSGAGAPGASTGNGKSVGHVYVDTTGDTHYSLVDATTDANVWDSGGDVVGPASVLGNTVVLWDGTTGKLIKDPGSQIGFVPGVFYLNGATMLRIGESATVPATPNAAQGAYWVRNDAPTAPMFTDDDGGDNALYTGVKAKVRAATAVAGTLTTDFENLDVIDGVTLATGDRILIKDQASATENGIYTVEATGSPTRALDLPTGSLAASVSMRVQEGTANADTEWHCTNNTGSDVVNTASLTFAQTGDVVSAGTTAQDALYLDMRPDHVNTPGADRMEIWSDDTFNTLQYVDETGVDRIIVGTVGIGTANAIPTFTGTKGAIENNSTFTLTTGALRNAHATTASFELQERSGAPSLTAGIGKIWIKDDVPNRLVFTDDTGTELYPAMTTFSGDGTADSIATFDGTDNRMKNNSTLKYGATSGELAISSVSAAVTLQERATAPANVAQIGKIWVKNTNPTQLFFTDDGTLDRPLVQGPTAAVTADAIPRWNSTTGSLIKNSSNLTLTDAGIFTLGGSTAEFTMAERAAAPISTTGIGKSWVRNTVPARKWYTDDESRDQRLGMQQTSISFQVSPNSTDDWFGWSTGGPYNDTLWSENWGTVTTPTPGNFRDHPPLIVLPGDTKIERVVGWYTTQGAVSTWEMELMALTFEDQDAYASVVVDVICDGSVNGTEITASNLKIAVADHTINDSSALPTDTNHMIGLYMCFRETTPTKIGVDLKGGVTIYWSTYSIDGWH